MNSDTLPWVFLDQVEKNKNNTFLMYKDNAGTWQDVTWQKAGEQVKLIAMGLIAIGAEKGDRISGISETRPKYAYCCTAITNIGAIFSPIYQTNSPCECAHVLNDTGSKIIFLENMTQYEKILQAEIHSHKLDKIIILEGSNQTTDKRVLTFEQLCDQGRDLLDQEGEQFYLDKAMSVKPEDVAAIIYTSGTTGPPKGVMDTNGGILNNIEEYIKTFPLEKNSRGLSFLPMAHALELRNGHWFHVKCGFPQIYPQSIRTVFDDARDMGVTFFFTTPRFFEKNYSKILSNIKKAPSWKKALINWSIETGRKYNMSLKNETNNGFRYLLNKSRYAFAWYFFINQVRDGIGPKLKYSCVGGAPAAPEIIEFYSACGLPLYEGYGLTEGQGMVSTNGPGANQMGTVGKPMDGIDIKIAEDGELLVKGWILGKGYWNNEEATKELYKGGWLNTGDLATVDQNGYMKITGRKKEIIITSGGKNVSPSFIENLIKMSGLISQAVVFGERKDYLTAIVTLNQEEIILFAKEENIDFIHYSDLTKKQEIITLIQSEIDIKNKELSKAEQIRKFIILADEFSQDRGELTPTFKIKRKVISSRYQDLVETMYQRS